MIDPMLVELKFLDRVRVKLRMLMSRRPVYLVDHAGDVAIVHAVFLPGHENAFLGYLAAKNQHSFREGVRFVAAAAEAQERRSAQAE